MGIVPDPNGYELGIPCVSCWNLKTPKYFLAVVTGVKKCPGQTASPNGFVLMGQVAACRWEGDLGFFTCIYQAIAPFPPGGSAFNIGTPFGTWFAGSNIDICKTVFSNDHRAIDCDPDLHGFGGSVGLYYGPGI